MSFTFDSSFLRKKMNILSPQLLWIENRCYRVNSTTNTNNYESETPLPANTYVEDGN